MSRYNFDEIVNRYHSNSCKYDVLDDEIPMTVADMDFHLMPEIKDTIFNRANIDAFGYQKLDDNYFKAYINWWKRRHNVEIKEEWMVYSHGVIASIDTIFRHLANKGDGVVLMTPVYNVFFNCITNNELELLDNKLKYQNGEYSIDWYDLEGKMNKENAKFLILCNPHNPTGHIFSKDEVTKICMLAHKHDILVISDEIHCDILKPGLSYYSAINLELANIVTLISPSKTFNIAGLNNSCVVTRNLELKNKIQEWLWHDDLGEPGYFSSDACLAAYNFGDEYVNELNQYVFANREYLELFVKQELPFIKVIKGESTYLAWLDISYYGLNSREFTEKLRKETGLVVSNGYIYGDDRFVRINLATSNETVKDACQKLKAFVLSL